MKLYIIKDFDDNIIGKVHDFETAVKVFKRYKPEFDIKHIDPFIYFVEIHFTECPTLEYDGVLKNRDLTLHKRLIRQLAILKTWDDIQFNGRVILDTFKIPGINDNRLPNYDMNNMTPKPHRERGGYIRFNPIPSSMKNH